MSALISIIVPVWNSEKTLDACVASILGQSFGDYEVILVDDGSTDGSANLCDSFASQHSNFKVAHIPHSGPSEARNKGLDLAEGDFVTFIDSDDEVVKSYLETLLNILVQNEADVSALSYQIVPRESKPSAIDYDAPVKIFTNEEAVLDLLYQNNLDSSQCFKLFRKECIMGIRFPKQYRVYEDLLFIYNVYCRCKKVAWANRKMYFYHKESSGQMDAICPLVDDPLKIVQDIRKDIDKRFPYEKFQKAIDNRTISISFNLLKRISQQGISNPEIETQCWENIKALRFGNLFDQNVRAKNKIGVIASLFGKRFFTVLARLQK